MSERATRAQTGLSPKVLSRTVGVLYLLTIVLGGLAQGLIAERLVVFGDAAATAANIRGNEGLYRLGYSLYLVEMACQIAMIALFYSLLRPVSQRVALVAMVLGLTGCVVKALSRLFYVAPLIVLGNAPSLAGAGQPEALALLFLRLNHQGEAMAMAFFGVHTLLVGWLVLRSTFLPRLLGAITILGGLAWSTYVSPPLGDRLVPFILPVAIVGALAMVGWLLIKGVDEQRWRERAA